jgi:trigger factor
LDIQFNKTNPNHGIISITLHEPDYKSAVEKQIKHYAQNVRLKGFRLGAVPIDLVRKMYGVSILSEELNKVAATSLHAYIQEESIPIFIESLLVDAPNEIDLKNQKAFTFSYEVGLLEDRSVELGPHISVTEFEIDRVDGKLVDEFLNGLQIVHGKSVDIQESSEDAILYGSIEEPTDGGQLGLRIAIACVPEHLRKALIGLSVNAEVMLTKEMIENHSAPVLGINFGTFAYIKNKGNFPYTLKISKIVHVTLAPITTELFDLVLGAGIADSESAFREAMAKIILFDKRTESRYALYDDLRNALLKHVPVELPDAFLKNWLLAKNPEATLEEIEAYYEAYQENLRWEILLGSVVKKNDLTVTQLDIVDEAKRISLDYLNKNIGDGEAIEYSDPGVTEAVFSFLKKDKGKNYIQLHERLSRDRAIDFIKKNISLVVETITAEEFDARR